ncbi:hypothetical protein BGH95_09740 [Snodgrassella alvi]|nr:hypothetical protein BGH95_09740 [Snodgrassella alvi]
MYAEGKGIKQNFKIARDYFYSAARKGHSGALNKLGLMFLSGNGVRQNYMKAVYYFCLAAKRGETEAWHNLGIMYVDGQGVKKNKRIARQLIKRSAVYKKPGTRSVDFISD